MSSVRLGVRCIGRYWVAILLLVPAAATGQEQEPLQVGVFPRRSPELTREMFAPMMGHLQQQLERRVVLDVPADFQAFWEALTEGRYDLVHLNQYQYLRANHRFGYRAILMNEELGRSRIAAVIWVRDDSGIKKPADLRGKKIIFGGGRHAMVSYIMALDLLRHSGLEDSDYLMQFAMNPVSALLSLYYHQGMAAGAGDVLPHLPALQNAIQSDEISPLLKSQAVAHLPWAVSSGLPERISKRIQTSLIELTRTQHGRRLLQQAGLSALVPAADRDYDPHRAIVARVLGEGF